MGIDFVKVASSNIRNSVLQAQADCDAALRDLQAARDQGVRDILNQQAQRDTRREIQYTLR